MEHDPVKNAGRAQGHGRKMLNAFDRLAKQKYFKGLIEHGGDLLDKSTLELLKEIRDEAIDTFIYAQTAIEKLEKP